MRGGRSDPLSGGWQKGADGGRCNIPDHLIVQYWSLRQGAFLGVHVAAGLAPKNAKPPRGRRRWHSLAEGREWAIRRLPPKNANSVR